MAYSSAVLADSPVGYWRLGEASGSVAVDSSASAVNLTYGAVVLGAPSVLPADQINTAVVLSGSTASFVTGSPPASFSGTSLTAELWVKTTASSGTLFSYLSSGANDEFTILDPGNLRFIVRNSAPAASGIAVNDGASHHIVLTYDGATAAMWIDGVMVRSGSVTGAVVASGVLYVGERQNPSLYNPCAGVFDEVAIYDHVLSDARIAAHYAIGIDLENFAPMVVNATSGAPSSVRAFFSRPLVNLNNPANYTIAGVPVRAVTYVDTGRRYVDLRVGDPAKSLEALRANSYSITGPASMIPAGTQHTVSVWVAFDGYGGNTSSVIFSKSVAGQYCFLRVSGGSRAVNFYWNNGNVTSVISSMVPGVFYNFILTVDYTGIWRIYVNGSQAAAQGGYAGPGDAGNFELGSNTLLGDETGDFRFAEVAVFEDDCIGPDGAVALYQHGAHGFPARYFPGNIRTLWEMETINVGQIDDVRSGTNPLTVSNVAIVNTGQTYLSEGGRFQYGTTYTLTVGGSVVDDQGSSLVEDTTIFEGAHWHDNALGGDITRFKTLGNVYSTRILPAPAISMVPQTGRQTGPIYRPHQTKLNRGIM